MVGKDEAVTKTRLPPKPQLFALSARGAPSVVSSVIKQDGALLEGTWGPRGSAEAISAAAPLTSQARRRRRAGQEPGTSKALLDQPAAVLWQQ